MTNKKILLVFLILIVAVAIAVFYYYGIYGDLKLKVTRVTDNVIIVSTSDGSGQQIAITSDSGLVVIGTLWGTSIAERYKSLVEKEFERSDFIYAVNTVDRLDYVGGNHAFKDAKIISHAKCAESLKKQRENLKEHLIPLIDMWRWKEGVARFGAWKKYCRTKADDMSKQYELLLPTTTFDDTLTLDLGNMSLKFLYFGKAERYNGSIVVHIPEEKLLITGTLLFHEQHLIPTLTVGIGEKLDIDRWLEVLDAVLSEGIEKLIVTSGQWQVQNLINRRDYIRKLWSDVKQADQDKTNLAEMMDKFSLDNRYSFVKDWDVCKQQGDSWIREEHDNNIKIFWSQLHEIAANIVGDVIEQEGIEAGISKFYELKNSDPGTYYFDESSFNSLGYSLMKNGKIEEAIEIFKLNVKEYPESANVYDSLGEAYKNDGQKELAIQNYEKSLELNPENNNAKEMLKRLGEKN